MLCKKLFVLRHLPVNEHWQGIGSTVLTIKLFLERGKNANNSLIEKHKINMTEQNKIQTNVNV